MRLLIEKDAVYRMDTLLVNKDRWKKAELICANLGVDFTLEYRDNRLFFTLYRQMIVLNEQYMNALFRDVFLLAFDMSRFQYCCLDDDSGEFGMMLST